MSCCQELVFAVHTPREAAPWQSAEPQRWHRLRKRGRFATGVYTVVDGGIGVLSRPARVAPGRTGAGTNIAMFGAICCAGNASTTGVVWRRLCGGCSQGIADCKRGIASTGSAGTERSGIGARGTGAGRTRSLGAIPLAISSVGSDTGNSSRGTAAMRDRVPASGGDKIGAVIATGGNLASDAINALPACRDANVTPRCLIEDKASLLSISASKVDLNSATIGTILNGSAAFASALFVLLSPGLHESIATAARL